MRTASIISLIDKLKARGAHEIDLKLGEHQHIHVKLIPDMPKPETPKASDKDEDDILLWSGR
jgi:hypothetical protein